MVVILQVVIEVSLIFLTEKKNFGVFSFMTFLHLAVFLRYLRFEKNLEKKNIGHKIGEDLMANIFFSDIFFSL